MTSKWASETAKLSEDDTTWPKDKKALVLKKLKEYEESKDTLIRQDLERMH